MLTPAQKEQLQDLCQHHPLAVLATADAAGNPAAAAVLFAHDDDFNIIFGTHPTRKYRNLKANPRAAVVLTKDWQQIQLHGSVVELTGVEGQTAQQLFMAKHPDMDRHLMEGSVFFRLTPDWIRYMDTGRQPPTQWEVKL